MYTLNIGDLPVNAEIPALKPIRVIRPIPNGKYLEHTIINVQTEGNKIIVDIPQIQLCHIRKYRADSRRMKKDPRLNLLSNYSVIAINSPNTNFNQLKYAVCIDLFQSGAARSLHKNSNGILLDHKNISRKTDDNSHTKIRSYGWTPILMQELDLNRSRYEFPISKIKWRKMITNCQKYEIRRLTRLLNGYPDLYDKVVNNYYMYARATIRSIRKYDYDESLKRAEMNEGIYKIGSDLRICSLWPNVKNSSFLKPEEIRIWKGNDRPKIRVVYTSCPWLEGQANLPQNLFGRNKKRPHHIKQEWIDKNKVTKLTVSRIDWFNGGS